MIVVFLPLAVAYQLVWSYFFSLQPSHFWQQPAAHFTLVGKTLGETIMYALMCGYIWCYAQSTQRIYRVVFAILTACLSLYSGYYLLVQLSIF
jgi:ABC-type proline/glycine betaine transport system permease subunit